MIDIQENIDMTQENVMAILLAVLQAKQDLADAVASGDHMRKIDAASRLLNLTDCLTGDKTLEALVDAVAKQRGVA